MTSNTKLFRLTWTVKGDSIETQRISSDYLPNDVISINPIG